MNRIKLALRITSAALAVVLLILVGIRWRQARNPAAPVSHVQGEMGLIKPFALLDQNSQSFGSEDLKGKPWVADFIFTRCMGPCPLVSKRMSDLHDEFKNKKDLRFVSFSVDPEFDTPNILNAYARTYGADPARWRFLTGPRDEIFHIIRDSFKLAVEPMPSDSGPLDIVHSLHFVLIEPDGRIGGFFNSNDAEAVDRLRAKLKELP